MAQTTPNLGLKVWNNSTDPYKYDELANNFVQLDLHDHSPGNGALIDGATAIKPGSIGSSQLGANSVSAGNIVDGSVGNAELGTGQISGSKISTTAGSRITGSNIEDATIGFDKFQSGALQFDLVDALPVSNLTEGRTIYYTNDKTTPAYVWQLRYSASASSGRWYFVGGLPWVTIGSDLSNLTSNSYNSGTSAFETTLPLVNGVWDITFALTQGNSTTSGCSERTTLAVSGNTTIAAGDGDSIVAFASATPNASYSNRSLRYTILGGSKITMQHKVATGGTGSFSDRSLSIQPAWLTGNYTS